MMLKSVLLFLVVACAYGKTILEEGQLVDGLFRVKNGRLVLEDDMVISEKDRGKIVKSYEIVPIPNGEGHTITKRAIPVRFMSRRWKVDSNFYHVVPYTFANVDAGTRQRFEDAVSKVEAAGSRLRFKRVDETLKGDYIEVFHNTGEGCWSHLGRQGGKQQISLENGKCEDPALALHLLMHAIGFLHEHSRDDRNDFVNVEWNNIEAGMENNFHKRKLHRGLSPKSPYDYKSVTHIRLDAFSKSTGQNTLTVKGDVPDANTIGMNAELSPIDIEQIKELYPCVFMDVWTHCVSWHCGGGMGIGWQNCQRTCRC